MITLITGAPGSGKTAALILLLQETLSDSGRTIYVHGIPDLKIPHQELSKPDEWPAFVPDGSIIIIDEVQNVWRPRGPGTRVPEHISALETHRHRGLDFYVITQGPNLVDSNVRALVGRHVHLRDLGFLGRWWYEWPECADNCRTGWKNAPIKKRYTLPKKIFGLYKSSSLHVKPIRSFPKMFFVAIFALVAVAFLSYRMYSSISDKISPASLAPLAPSFSFTNGSQSSSGQGPKPLTAEQYISAYQPRIEGLAHTAPRYDEVQKVAQAPRPAACIDGVKPGSGGVRSCECWTQQATILPVPELLCKQIAQGGYFDDTQPLPVSNQQLQNKVSSSVSALSPELPGATLLASSGHGVRDSGYLSERNAQTVSLDQKQQNQQKAQNQ